MSKKQYALAFGAGVLFAVGLAVAGMTQPSKVIGFLDFAGDWDPSLAFVMGGAIAVYLPLYRLVVKRPRPLFAERFALPTRKDIDPRLLAGAALFGVGWGLGGFCPGPAITAIGGFVPQALLAGGAMLVGFLAHDLFARRMAAKSGR